MIEGLKARLTSEQLSALLATRRDEHSAKAKRYELRVLEMKQAGDDPTMATSNDKSTIESFERRVNEHRSKASEFQFLFDYLPNGEVFELGWEELHRLEVVSRY